MTAKNIIISLFVVILLVAAGWAYWYFLMGPVTIPIAPEQPKGQEPFQPLGRPPQTGTGTSPTGTVAPSQPVAPKPGKMPALRLLSGTPVGGYGASTTASTTKILWVDRGRGNVYSASMDSTDISTLSNTVVPKIFQSVWNKNLTSFIGSLFEDGFTPTVTYVEIIKQTKTTTTSSVAPYELRGKNIAGNIIGYAASPDRSQLVIVMNENGNGVGYVSSFNAQNPTRVFSTPLTEINVSWPSDNIIAITTKGSANYGGFLYFVNPKSGEWTKILGPIQGLSTSVSHTGKYVLYSGTGKNNDIITSIYSVGSNSTTDGLIKTLAEKCAWGNFYKDIVYCGVPTQLAAARYPDAWYLGTVSTADKIWQMNAATGEVIQISSLVEQADRLINAFNLELDPQDKYLFFMNKNDLSLWSLDLVKPR